MSDLKSIFGEMDDAVKNEIEMSPSWWINQSMKLHVLFSSEYKRYFTLKKDLAQKKAEYLRENIDMPVSKAKAYIEGLDEYWEAEQLKSQKKYVDDMIMLAKKMATMALDEVKGY